MTLVNLIVIYLYRKYGVPLHIFFSKNGPEIQATLITFWLLCLDMINDAHKLKIPQILKFKIKSNLNDVFNLEKVCFCYYLYISDRLAQMQEIDWRSAKLKFMSFESR